MVRNGANRAGGAEVTHSLGQSLSQVMRWGRVRLHERLCRMAKMQVERSTLDILGTIRQHGELPRAALCDMLGVNQSTVSRQAAAAVDAEYLVTRQAPDGGRVAVLALTASGRRLQQKFADAYDAIIAKMVEDWTAQDRAELTRLLEKLTDQIEKETI